MKKRIVKTVGLIVLKDNTVLMARSEKSGDALSKDIFGEPIAHLV